MDRCVHQAVGMENVGGLHILYQREASAFARFTPMGIPEPQNVGRATRYRFSRYSFLPFLKPKRRVRRQPIYHMKKFLSLLCAAIIGFSNLTHAYDFEVDGIYYNILSENDCTAEVTNSGDSNIKYEGDIVIPSSVSFNEITHIITTIGDYAFCECPSLNSVILPESLTSIGSLAFSSCKALSSVTFPKTLTTIGDWAFYECSALTSVTFPEKCKITTIGSLAFSDCLSLISVTIPESLTTIGMSAFSSCPILKSVTLPESLTSIEYGAFCECSSLTSVSLPKTGKLTAIGDYAFYECSSLCSVTFPESLSIIGENAFYGCI